MPRPPAYNDRAVKIGVETDGTEKSLPLEGKPYASQVRRMKFMRIGACRRPYKATPVGFQEFDRLHPLSHT